jgi:hypothetical protein
MFLHYIFPEQGFLYDIWKSIDSNSSLGVFYSIDPTIGKIGYMHEALSHFLFSYGVLVVFEVI